jgi:hypothetical protein
MNEPPASGLNAESGQISDNVSILAEFYVLDGLNVEIILGEDLLASVSAFAAHSRQFKAIPSSNSLYPGLATISLMRKSGQRICDASGRRVSFAADRNPLLEQDTADSKEWDRYEREQERIKSLTSWIEKEIATRGNERTRQEYLWNRDHMSSRLLQQRQ